MGRKKIAAIAAVLCVIASGIYFTAGPASAQGAPPNDCYTISYYNSAGKRFGMACFQWYGDDHWVNDQHTNGRRVGVNIETNYSKYRRCENTNGSGTWKVCRFDHREDKCVRWQGYEYDGDTGKYYNVSKWSSWRKISNGKAC